MDLTRFFYEAKYNTIDDGRFFFPSKILWGRGVLDELDHLLGPTAEVFVDASVFQTSLISERLAELRRRQGTRIEIVDKPSYERVVEYCRTRPDVSPSLLAIGGGSTFDFCKATIAVRCLGGLSGLGIGTKSGEQTAIKALPTMISVPTTCGSGAEASRYVVTYSDDTNAKVHGKSWGLVADWILVEPTLLMSAPIDTVVASAFDAFVHFFETLAMRSETSLFSEMLSIFGMTQVILNLTSFLGSECSDIESAQNLMLLGTLGGVSISNTRTGHIHEAAGALIEHVSMSHGYSLYVFFEHLAQDVFTAIPSRFNSIWSILGDRESTALIRNEGELFCWWDRVFSKTDFKSRCHRLKSEYSNKREQIHSAILNRIQSDSVWMTKECPYRPDVEKISKQVRDATQCAFLESM